MKRSILSVIAVGAAALSLTVTACDETKPSKEAIAAANPAAAPSADPGDENGEGTSHAHHWDVSWMTVGSFEEMAGRSDLIVRGRVVGQRYDVIRSYPQGREGGDVYKDTPITISTVQIEEVVGAGAGVEGVEQAAVAVGTRVEIQELGGKSSCGCLISPEDLPNMPATENGIYFLSKARVDLGLGKSRGGRFDVVGGYQGRFSIENGTVSSLAALVHPTPSFNRLNGAALADVIGEARAASTMSTNGSTASP